EGAPYDYLNVRRDSSHTQAFLGLLESAGMLWLAGSAVDPDPNPGRLPRRFKLLPEEVAPGQAANIEEVARNKIANAKMWEQAAKGSPLLRNATRAMKLAGAYVLLQEVKGRVYQWGGSDHRPSWSPVVDYFLAKSGGKLENLPQLPMTLEP